MEYNKQTILSLFPDPTSPSSSSSSSSPSSSASMSLYIHQNMSIYDNDLERKREQGVDQRHHERLVKRKLLQSQETLSLLEP